MVMDRSKRKRFPRILSEGEQSVDWSTVPQENIAPIVAVLRENASFRRRRSDSSLSTGSPAKSGSKPKASKSSYQASKVTVTDESSSSTLTTTDVICSTRTRNIKSAKSPEPDLLDLDLHRQQQLQGGSVDETIQHFARNPGCSSSSSRYAENGEEFCQKSVTVASDSYGSSALKIRNAASDKTTLHPVVESTDDGHQSTVPMAHQISLTASARETERLFNNVTAEEVNSPIPQRQTKLPNRERLIYLRMKDSTGQTAFSEPIYSSVTPVSSKSKQIRVTRDRDFCNSQEFFMRENQLSASEPSVLNTNTIRFESSTSEIRHDDFENDEPNQTPPVKKRKYTKNQLSSPMQYAPFVNVNDELITYKGAETQTLLVRPCFFDHGRPHIVNQTLKVQFNSVDREQSLLSYYTTRRVDIIHFETFNFPLRVQEYVQYLGHGLYIPEKKKGVKTKRLSKKTGSMRRCNEKKSSDAPNSRMPECSDEDGQEYEPRIYLYSSSGYQPPADGRDFVVYTLALCKFCRKKDPLGGKSCLLWLGMGNASKLDNHVRKVHPDEFLKRCNSETQQKFLTSYGSDSSYKTFVHCLYDLMVSNNLPISFLSHPALHALIQVPYGKSVGLPHPASFRAHLEKTMNEKLSDKIEAIKAEIACATLIIDTWESKLRKKILAVMIAYVDHNFEFRQFCLHVAVLESKMDEGATGKKIADAIIQVLTEHKLKDKLTYCITDSGSNTIKAFNFYEEWLDADLPEELDTSPPNFTTREPIQMGIKEKNNQNIFARSVIGANVNRQTTNSYLEDLVSDDIEDIDDEFEPGVCDVSSFCIDENMEQATNPIKINYKPDPPPFALKLHTQYRCAAHSLQNSVAPAIAHKKKAPAYVRSLHDYVMDLIRYIRGSEAMGDLVTKLCGKSLKMPGKTRWNSFIDALGRLSEPKVFGAVQYVLQLQKRMVGGPKSRVKAPPVPSKTDFHRIQMLFRILLPVAAATDSLQQDGITSQLLIYEILILYLHVSQVPGLDPDIEQAKNLILGEIIGRFRPTFKSNLFIAATIFNPRTKRLFEWIDKVLPKNPFGLPTHHQALSILKSMMPPYVLQEGSHAMNQPSAYGNNGSSTIKRRIGFVPMARPSISKTSFELYLSEAVDEDPLDLPSYWKLKRDTWPLLAGFVLYFCMPITTGSVERLFSRLKLINTNQRSRLDASMMSTLVLYNQFFMREETTEKIEKRKRKFARMIKQVGSSNYCPFHTGIIDGETGFVLYNQLEEPYDFTTAEVVFEIEKNFTLYPANELLSQSNVFTITTDDDVRLHSQQYQVENLDNNAIPEGYETNIEPLVVDPDGGGGYDNESLSLRIFESVDRVAGPDGN